MSTIGTNLKKKNEVFGYVKLKLGVDQNMN